MLFNHAICSNWNDIEWNLGAKCHPVIQLSFHELLYGLDAESIIMIVCSETRSVVVAGSFPLLYSIIARRITSPSASGKNGANIVAILRYYHPPRIKSWKTFKSCKATALIHNFIKNNKFILQFSQRYRRHEPQHDNIMVSSAKGVSEIVLNFESIYLPRDLLKSRLASQNV